MVFLVNVFVQSFVNLFFIVKVCVRELLWCWWNIIKRNLKKIFSDHDGYIGFMAFFFICYLLGLLSNGLPWRFCSTGILVFQTNVIVFYTNNKRESKYLHWTFLAVPNKQSSFLGCVVIRKFSVAGSKWNYLINELMVMKIMKTMITTISINTV